MALAQPPYKQFQISPPSSLAEMTAQLSVGSANSSGARLADGSVPFTEFRPVPAPSNTLPPILQQDLAHNDVDMDNGGTSPNSGAEMSSTFVASSESNPPSSKRKRSSDFEAQQQQQQEAPTVPSLRRGSSGTLPSALDLLADMATSPNGNASSSFETAKPSQYARRHSLHSIRHIAVPMQPLPHPEPNQHQRQKSGSGSPPTNNATLPPMQPPHQHQHQQHQYSKPQRSGIHPAAATQTSPTSSSIHAPTPRSARLEPAISWFGYGNPTSLDRYPGSNIIPTVSTTPDVEQKPEEQSTPLSMATLTSSIAREKLLSSLHSLVQDYDTSLLAELASWQGAVRQRESAIVELRKELGRCKDENERLRGEVERLRAERRIGA